MERKDFLEYKVDTELHNYFTMFTMRIFRLTKSNFSWLLFRVWHLGLSILKYWRYLTSCIIIACTANSKKGPSKIQNLNSKIQKLRSKYLVMGVKEVPYCFFKKVKQGVTYVIFSWYMRFKWNKTIYFGKPTSSVYETMKKDFQTDVAMTTITFQYGCQVQFKCK